MLLHSHTSASSAHENGNTAQLKVGHSDRTQLLENKRMGRVRRPRSGRKRGIAAAFARLDIAIRHCRAALLFSDLKSVTREVRLAKKSYAAALRAAWRLSLTTEDVAVLDYKSNQLQELIFRLEERYKRLNAQYESDRP